MNTTGSAALDCVYKIEWENNQNLPKLYNLQKLFLFANWKIR